MIINYLHNATEGLGSTNIKKRKWVSWRLNAPIILAPGHFTAVMGPAAASPFGSLPSSHLNLGVFLLGASGSVRANVYSLLESHPSQSMRMGRFCTCSEHCVVTLPWMTMWGRHYSCADMLEALCNLIHYCVQLPTSWQLKKLNETKLQSTVKSVRHNGAQNLPFKLIRRSDAKLAELLASLVNVQH